MELHDLQLYLKIAQYLRNKNTVVKQSLLYNSYCVLVISMLSTRVLHKVLFIQFKVLNYITDGNFNYKSVIICCYKMTIIRFLRLKYHGIYFTL